MGFKNERNKIKLNLNNNLNIIRRGKTPKLKVMGFKYIL